jgi:hypothetical protein
MLQAGRSPVRVPDEVNFFNLSNPSSHTIVLGSTQPITKMSTKNIPGDKKWPALTTLPPSLSRMPENVGASTSRNLKGLHGLYRDNFTFCLTYDKVQRFVKVRMKLLFSCKAKNYLVAETIRIHPMEVLLRHYGEQEKFKEMCSVCDGKYHSHDADCSNDFTHLFISKCESLSEFSLSVIQYLEHGLRRHDP